MARTMDEVLDDIGLGTFHFVQLLLIGGVMVVDGAEILVSSSLLSALKHIWHLSPMVRGLMMSMIFVGVLIGSLIGGHIGDKYGRRKAILTSYVGIVIFGIATATAQGPISMCILRFFFGMSFGCGMGPGVALMVETAPTKMRAHVVNFGGLWFTLGEIYTAVLLIIFMPDLTDPTGTHWRWVTLLSMVPGLLLFPVTYMFLQESPSFLLGQGRNAEAVHALQYIATMNGQAALAEGLESTDTERRLKLPRGSKARASALLDASAGSAASALLEERRLSVGSQGSVRSVASAEEAEETNQTTTKEIAQVLWSSENRGIVIGGAYLCFLGNFLFYGFTYALPQIFGKLGQELEPALQVLIVSFCDLPGVLLAFVVIMAVYAKGIDQRGGLVTLALCAAVLSLTLISIDHGQEGLYVALPAAYLIKFVSSAFFTCTYVYLSEVFPSRVRASGLSVCFAAGRVGSIMVPLIVESLHEKGFPMGEHAPFLLLSSVLCLLGVVVIKLFLTREHSNVPLQEFAPSSSSGSEDNQEKDDRLHLKEARAKNIDPEMAAPAG